MRIGLSILKLASLYFEWYIAKHCVITADETAAKSGSIDAHVIMAYETAMKEGSQSSNQFKLVTLDQCCFNYCIYMVCNCIIPALGAEGAEKTTSVNTLNILSMQLA